LFTETIRKYPGLPFLNRECTDDYPVPGTNHIITKGTPILISLYGIQRDPAYFPNPNGYDPHRFDADTMNYDQAAYMPFGEGPRHCIGEDLPIPSILTVPSMPFIIALRMGKINSKVAVAKVLANFDLIQAPRKEVEFRFDAAPVLVTKEPLKLRLTKRK